MPRSSITFLLVLVLASTAGRAHADDADWKRFNDAGWVAVQDGRIKDAEKLLEEAVKEGERLGRDDPRLGLSLAQLAWLRMQEKKPAEAAELAGRALTLFDKPSDRDTPEEARALNVLARLAQEQKKNAEAEALYKRALAVEEKVSGREHAGVAQLLSNLGVLYQSQGRYEEAESAFQRALAIRQKAFGSSSVQAAVSLSQLGILAHDRHHDKEAEPLLRKALEIRQKALPVDDPDMVLSLNNLATLYADQGRYKEAEPLLREALAARERTLGRDHLKVAAVLYNLASLYKDQHKYKLAASNADRALKIRESKAPDSLELAATYELMARIQAGMDKTMNATAVTELKRALEIRKKVQGDDHRDVAVTTHLLANAYRDVGNYPAAEDDYKRARALAEKCYGKSHVGVAKVLEDYAALLVKMKDRASEATRLRDEAKKIREKAEKKS
jgi:tetratricopeptide (TPR) repeat protein